MIIVGYTGEKASVPAVEVAARLSARTGTPMKIVNAFDAPTMDLGLYTVAAPPDQAEVTEWRRSAMSDAESVARREGATDITQEVVLAPPASALLRSAGPEDVLVVGHRQRGEFTSALLGSVAIQVSAHASCPVVVIGKESHTDWSGPFVVGVDGSPASRKAALTAAAWCEAHRLPLRIVAAWQDEVLISVGETWAYTPMVEEDTAIAQATETMVAQVAHDVTRAHPQVEVSTLVERGDAARVILDAAEDATALFTGSRGRGGFAGLMLGSVSHQLLHRARVPVVVVR